MRRLPGRRAPFLALDFETTGLDLAHDRIVSFGAVPLDDGAIRMAAAEHRIVDAGDRTPSRTSVQIHGLRPVDVAAGMAPAEATARLRSLLRQRYLLAWYADVEIGFLARMFGTTARRWRPRTVDVRDLFLAEVPGGDRTSLSSAAAAYDVPVADPHQALDDALVTAQLFLVLAARRERREGRSVPVTAFIRTAAT